MMTDEKMPLEGESEEVLGDVKLRITQAKTFVDAMPKLGETVVLEVTCYVRRQIREHTEGKGAQKEAVLKATSVKVLD